MAVDKYDVRKSSSLPVPREEKYSMKRVGGGAKIPEVLDSADWQKKILQQTRDYLDFDVRMPTADGWFGNWLEGFDQRFRLRQREKIGKQMVENATTINAFMQQMVGAMKGHIEFMELQVKERTVEQFTLAKLNLEIRREALILEELETSISLKQSEVNLKDAEVRFKNAEAKLKEMEADLKQAEVERKKRVHDDDLVD